MDFWNRIFQFYSNVYGRHLTPDNHLIILGCSSFSLTLPTSLQQALMFGSVVAKRVILREWKSSTPPCFKKWLNDMVSCIYLEEIWYSLSDSYHKFLDMWGPFNGYIQSNGLKWLSWPFGSVFVFLLSLSSLFHFHPLLILCCFMLHCLDHIVSWTAFCPFRLCPVLVYALWIDMHTFILFFSPHQQADRLFCLGFFIIIIIIFYLFTLFCFPACCEIINKV